MRSKLINRLRSSFVLSYRHIFHAGNTADCLKHSVLALIIQTFGQKAKPFCYFESHAGAGYYDLHDPRAQQNREFADGIAHLWPPNAAAPCEVVEALRPYLDAVTAENQDSALRYYPGSPHIAHRLLRDGDRMILCELQREEVTQLRQRFGSDARVAIHHADGYQQLRALLPPTPRRGVLMIDSGFDRAEEMERVAEAALAARRRWHSASVVIWYPRFSGIPIRRFLERISAGLKSDHQQGGRGGSLMEIELITQRSGPGMIGSGLLLIDPPWGLEQQLEPLLRWLYQRLAHSAAPQKRYWRWLIEPS